MSLNSDKTEGHTSSAPDEFQRRSPPPSYEECIKVNEARELAQNDYILSNSIVYPHHQVFQPSLAYAQPLPQLPYGAGNPYAVHTRPQQILYGTSISQPPVGAKPAENVLYLAKGAKIRTTSTGAISIPPPPPGCLPTTAQAAAMAGQPVVIKKQKKSFF